MPQEKIRFGEAFIERTANQYIIWTNVEAHSGEEAVEITAAIFKNSLISLVLTVQMPYNLRNYRAYEITPRLGPKKRLGTFALGASLTKPLVEEQIMEAKIISDCLKGVINQRKKQAIKYFIQGVNLQEHWSSEAFLSFFKIIELISGEIVPIGELKTRERKKAETLFQTKSLPLELRKYQGEIVNMIVRLQLPFKKSLRKLVNKLDCLQS